METKEQKQFHFIGIGGIGMSALARFALAKKYLVFGSDAKRGKESQKLIGEGANVFFSHEKSNIQNSKTTVVYSSAIADDNPEIIAAKQKGCLIWHRSEMLAEIMSQTNSLTVAGTHGKTTVSSLLAHILKHAKKDPSYILGGLLKPDLKNCHVGAGKYFVAELDESDGSLVNYKPNYAIVTNLELDHHNHYKDFDSLKKVFEDFTKKVSKELIWCCDCPGLTSLKLKGQSYGFSKNADAQIINFQQKGKHLFFDLKIKDLLFKQIKAPLLGPHQAQNSAAVFLLGLNIGLSDQEIREGLLSFNGVARRSDFIGSFQEIEIFDDYAHHPTEVECVLKGFRKAYPKRRIIAIFQPHRISRFEKLKDEFSKSFKKASEVWLTDIFSCGEQESYPINLNDYAAKIEENSKTSAQYVSQETLLKCIRELARPYDVIITIGAGDITQLAPQALEEIKICVPKLKIAHLIGSCSVENHVSFFSSDFYKQASSQNHFENIFFEQNGKGQWFFCEKNQKVVLNPFELAQKLKEVDFAALIAHGRGGEDGELQGFLRTLKIPFSGANTQVSALLMNKIVTKQWVSSLGISVPQGIFFNQFDWQKNDQKKIKDIKKKLSFPLVVKGANLGSTVALSFVNDSQELKNAIDKVFEFDHQVIIEQRLFGRELEVSCLDTEEGLRVAHPGEVVVDKRAYDYNAKYSNNPIEKIVNAPIEASLAKKCQSFAKKIYRSLNVEGFLRIDFFLVKNKLIFCEANTLPGTTPRSLFHRTLIAQGLSSKAIFNQMVIDGLYRKRLYDLKSFTIKAYLKEVEHVIETKTPVE